ncbi:cysteine synthase A [Bacteroides sp. OF04-15BH]|uniref:cysteine synthase A n=1 Tax=Bacteroides sp. OF04-15BH TaxID=2292281 RepID=UPI000E4C641D|nr:cysteine synthase A [Bacteroides sp. OF04-15BH]RHP66907.1 cysteine synthase A [Bacteroides sp. OF04-15BH]
MKIAESLTQLIGRTPLLRLNAYSRKYGLGIDLIAKLESFNPAGSAKDRPALYMIEDAERKGILRPGATIIEPTSGNMGVGLAMVAAVKGYQMVLVMPETMSLERRNLARALNARVVLSPAAEGMAGSVRMARELQQTTENAVILAQFENPANPLAHQETTAREIWEDTDGQVDVVIAGVGTGGTITGLGRGLKALNPQIEIVAVEPAASPLITEGKAGPHKLQGIGANFIPENYDASVVDRVLTVTDDDSIRTARELAADEGILAGITSGTAVYAARMLAQDPAYAGKRIVVVLPDTGERYLSTYEFDFENYPL